MSALSRREFLVRTSAAAASVAGLPLLGHWALGEQTAAVSPIRITSGTDVVTLGKTGIKTTVLGIGTGTVGGSQQRALGPNGFARLVHQAYERGIRYIDTADMYKMHAFIAPVLKELPRETMFIQTKTTAKTAEAAKADVERFRQELGLETLDTVLMHCMTRKNWPVDLRPVLDALLEAKQKGRLRAVGVSCHTLEALGDAADCDELGLHLVRINHRGEKMDGPPEQVAAQVEKMYQKGRGVIGMKIYGEGVFKTRPERLESLKYVLSLGTVHAFTIGFVNIQEIDETLELIRQATA